MQKEQQEEKHFGLSRSDICSIVWLLYEIRNVWIEIAKMEKRESVFVRYGPLAFSLITLAIVLMR